MFGLTLPPGIETLRILALTGKQGKPPCLWEGPATTEQSAIEAAIGRDPRKVQWLRRHRLIQDGIATLNLQIDCFSQGRRVESYTVSDIPIMVAPAKRRQQTAGDEAVHRALDLCEYMMHSYKEILEERDTVIGRLVERGLRAGDERKPVEAPPQSPVPERDTLDDLLEKGTKFLALANGFRSLRTDDN